MHTHPAGFDNPEFALDRTSRCKSQKFAQAALKKGDCGRPTKLKYDDAGTAPRRKSRHLTEISIQCDQCSAFGYARPQHDIVRGARQPFLTNSHHVVTSLP